MTTKDQPRRIRRSPGEGNGSGSGPSISDKLRAAREAKGLDLYRAERDTKIRVRFLSALENGDYAELPGDVYARGFLRNYATYLGLDPDAAEVEWRLEQEQPVVAASSELPAAEVEARSKQDAPPLKSGPVANEPVKKKRSKKAASVAAVGVPPHEEWQPKPKAETAKVAWSVWIGEMAQSTRERVVHLLRPNRPPTPAEQAMGGPQPITMPRRAFLQPVHFILLAVAVVMVAVFLFFGNQVANLTKDPSLKIASPDAVSITLPTGTINYTISGTTNPKATILISWDGRPANQIIADASGRWSYVAPLHAGLNQFDIHSRDEGTNHDSAVQTRVINVPSPTASPAPLLLTVDSPTDGQTFNDSNVTIKGSSVGVTSILITPKYVGVPPDPGATPTPTPRITPTPIPTIQPTMVPLPTDTIGASPSASTKPKPTPAPTALIGPGPIKVIPDIHGKFSVPLRLTGGYWDITAVGSDDHGGTTQPVKIRVLISVGALKVVITLVHGDATLKVWRDGVVLKGFPATYHQNNTVTILAASSVWIRTSYLQHTYVTINGVAYGLLGGNRGRGAASFRITATGPPIQSNDV
jgi:transcriptional regulator with XRE-family HTH domain